VADIAVEKNDLVIATHGRSFYVLDDIGVLRQWTPAVTKGPIHLFGPRPAIRSLKPAVIDYYLASAGKVTIDIFNAQGQSIRSFNNAPAKAGSNRFEWDLRYPGAITFPGIVLRYATPGEGPVAPPGEYSIHLTVNGVTETKRLQIQKDPRLTDVTDADLQEQFRLAIQIRDQTDRAHRAILEIRSIKEQWKQREQADPSIAARAAQVRSKLDEVEQDLYQVKNRSPRDTLNYPIKLNNQLAVLEHQVDTGDSRPTDQDYAVFKELSARLDQILARLNAIKAP
jgi:hypothetical protein